MMVLFCVSIVLLLVSTIAISFCLTSAQNSFLMGQRVAYKNAISHVRQRGELAVLLAPRGMLSDGLQRAQVSHQIIIDLNDFLNQVR